MIIEFTKNCSDRERVSVRELLEKHGFTATLVATQRSSYFVAIGKSQIDIRTIGHLTGVKDVHRVSDDYKLVSKKWKVGRSVIELDSSLSVGPHELTIMAGPCSVESRDQLESIADHLDKNGIRVMRGGAFKPRTSPYSFQGLGLEGLKLLKETAQPKGIKVISEVLRTSQIEEMYEYVDIYQVGARNTQNFSLLHELGKVDKPVLLKRGISGTIEELLQSAEYIFSSGNEKLILCERGIRTFENAARNTLDINAVPILKEKSHLPVIIDPSHGIGIRRHVEAVALAGLMAGADGIIIEVHPQPECALSDGAQTLNYEEASSLYQRARRVFDLKSEFSSL